MKLKRSNLFTTALNTAHTALNVASGVFQELNLPENTTTLRYRLSPYGEFPVDDVEGKSIIQVVDREAAMTMAANFRSLAGKFANFFRGIPIYEGHADDEDWVKANPGHKASAVGRIKSIEAGEDGIYVTSALNSAGVDLLGGDAPKYTGHSPLWRLSAIPGRPGFCRPILLWSDALTNTPNIMTNSVALNSLQGNPQDVETETSPDAGSSGANENPEPTDDMKLTPEALKALGFAPDATPSIEEISAAIVKMCSDKATAEADKATAEGTTTALNSRLSLMETELNLVRGSAVDAVIEDAIATGRITEADKPAWTTALNTSFKSESDKIKALMPTINTTNRLGNLNRRDLANDLATTDALNTAVRSIATQHGLNLENRKDYDRAWALLRTAKPELFENK